MTRGLPARPPVICLVTDRRRLCSHGMPFESVRECLVRQAHSAVDAGVDLIQIREADLEAADLGSLVSAIVDAAQGTSTRVVVNDRLDVAIACGADGVHLRADSMPAAVIRGVSPAGFLVGRSVHGRQEAIESAAGADYLIAGTVWTSWSKTAGRALLGEAGLAEIVRAVPVPVLGIGGVNQERVPRVAATGAAGFAAIGLFLDEGSRASCRVVPLRDRVAAARRWFDTVETGF